MNVNTYNALPPCSRRIEANGIWCDTGESVVERNELECRRCKATRGKAVTAREWRDLPDADREKYARRLKRV
jgi:hypothetical protein